MGARHPAWLCPSGGARGRDGATPGKAEHRASCGARRGSCRAQTCPPQMSDQTCRPRLLSVPPMSALELFVLGPLAPQPSRPALPAPSGGGTRHQHCPAPTLLGQGPVSVPLRGPVHCGAERGWRGARRGERGTHWARLRSPPLGPREPRALTTQWAATEPARGPVPVDTPATRPTQQGLHHETGSGAVTGDDAGLGAGVLGRALGGGGDRAPEGHLPGLWRQQSGLPPTHPVLGLNEQASSCNGNEVRSKIKNTTGAHCAG